MWCWCWRIKTGLRGSGVRGFRCVGSTRVTLFIVWSRTINSTNTIIYFNMTPHTIFSSPSRLVSMGMKSSHWAAGPRVFSRSNNKRLLNQSELFHSLVGFSSDHFHSAEHHWVQPLPYFFLQTRLPSVKRLPVHHIWICSYVRILPVLCFYFEEAVRLQMHFKPGVSNAWPGDHLRDEL